MNNYLLKPLTAAVMATALTGCLSSGSSSDGTGSMSLDVTDAPVDSLEKVVITFTGATLKPADGERFRIDFDEPKTLNMLELTRGNSESLFNNEEVPAGEYNFILLHLTENEAFPDMFVEDDAGNTHDLQVSSAQGLRLVSGFNVPRGGSADFTIDFDVRKAVVNPSAENQPYKLRPALRLLNNVEIGSVAGDVFQEARADCTDDTTFAGLVYVYEGAGVEPVDFNINRSDDEPQPLLAAEVEMLEGDDEFSYQASFLAEGDYTIAYSCTMDDNEADDTLTFRGTRDVTIVANETQVENFPESAQ